jgi:cytochrome c-type biogenesis protein CcmE
MTDTRPAPPAPVKKPLQKRYIVAAIVCVGIAVWMLTVLKNNAVYLRPVSDAVAHRDSQGARTFRMGGTVVPGSIESRKGGADFMVAEGGATAQVDYSGGPRDLFKDCAPVVVEGHWSGTTFVADRLLIRHGSEYDAKKRASADCSAGTNQ